MHIYYLVFYNKGGLMHFLTMLKNESYVYGEGQVEVPHHLNYGQHMLDTFRTYKNSVALIDAASGNSLTYADVSKLTVDVALSLAHIGVKKGQIVSICSEERLEYTSTMLGIICAGATFAPIDSSGKATILHRLNLVKPTVVFCSLEAYQEHRETLESVDSVEHYIVYGKERCAGATLFDDFLCARAPLERFIATPVDGTRDYACIVYSSGTTGLPKCIPLTHMNMLIDLSIIIDNSSGRYTGKRVLTSTEFPPMQHACLNAGSTIVFVLKDSAAVILDAVQKYKVEILQQLPSVAYELVYNSFWDKYELSSIEKWISAAAPLSAKLLKALEARLPKVTVRQIYGSTEGGAICSDERTSASKPNSVGRVVPAVVMKVVDLTTRQPLGPNQRGEICIKGPAVFPGYLGDTSSAHVDQEGFYKTGDIGYYDEDKYFYLVARVNDMIKCHGFSIAPAELEAIIAQHPAVHEVAVVGVPDEQYFELPTAFVVLQPDANVTAQELTDYVNNQVAHWMRLAGGVRFLATLPRGVRRKIDRNALKKMSSK